MNAAVEMPAPLLFTDAAAMKVKALIEEEGNPELKLRVFVQGGGCSGFQYGFTFDEVINEDDATMEKNGVMLLIDSMSYQYLVGAEIDYKEDLEGAQFVIKNRTQPRPADAGHHFLPEEFGLTCDPGRAGARFCWCHARRGGFRPDTTLPSTLRPPRSVTSGTAPGSRRTKPRAGRQRRALRPDRTGFQTRLKSATAGSDRCRKRAHEHRLRAPPPQAMTSTAEPHQRSIASLIVRAVNSISVRCRSAGGQFSSVAASSQAAENSSRPVLFGGGFAKKGSESNCDNTASLVRPCCANLPSRSIAVPRWRAAFRSSSTLPDRNRTRAWAGSYPQKRDVADAADVDDRTRRIRSEYGGMKCGDEWGTVAPAARSRLRKSAMTSMPMASARCAGAFS